MVTAPAAHIPRLLGDSKLGPREQARQHLLTIFRGELQSGEHYELRCLDLSVRPATKGPRLYFRSLTELSDAAIRYREQWDVFFGVGLRRCPVAKDINACPHRERGRDHISRLPAAWGDFDLHSDGDREHGLETLVGKLLSGSPPPTVLVASGTGIHAYWPLVEPTPDLERVEAVNRSVKRLLGGDNAVDAARVLRVAGTFNRKYREPLPVQLLRCPHV